MQKGNTMNLVGITLINFLSYQEQIIKFGEKEGIYLIYGVDKQTGEHNGVGKSALKEAIRFGLYGKCRMDSADDLIHFNKKEMIVKINFEQNGQKYEVIRKRIKEKKSELKFIYKNKEKKLTCNKLKDTQKEIERIIGINYEQFMQSFCFGQSPFDNLRSLTSSKIIEFLKSVLELERFDYYLNKTREIRDENERKLERLLGIKEACSKLKPVKLPRKQWLGRKIKLMEKKNKFEKELEKLNENDQSVEEEILKLENNHRMEDRDFFQFKRKLHFIDENEKCPECNSKLKGSALEKKYKEGIKNKKEQLNKIKNKLNGLYPKKEGVNKKIEQLAEVIERIKVIIQRIDFKLSENRIDKKVFDENEYKKRLKVKGIVEKATEVFNSKGLPLYILEYYIPKLELAINNALRRLGNFQLELRTKKNLKSSGNLRDTCEFILYRGNKEHSLDQLSDGEEFLIALGIRVGVSKLYNINRNFQTLILDEVFGKLGKVNREKVMKLINSLKEQFKKILVISHLDDIQRWRGTNKIFIEKDKGISKVTEVKNDSD